MAKAALNKEKSLFSSKLDLPLTKTFLNSTFGPYLYMVLKLGTFRK